MKSNPSYEVIAIENPVEAELAPMCFCKCLSSHNAGWGTGRTEDARVLTAYAEAVERDTIFALSEDAVSPIIDDKNLLIPADAAEILGEDIEIEWVRFSNYFGEEALVHRPTRGSSRFRLFDHNSTGIAVHSSREAALDTAIHEIIERGALTEFLAGHRHARQIESPNSETEFEDAVIKFGWSSHFFQLNVEGAFVVLCAIKNETSKHAPFRGMCFGAKSSNNLAKSCEGAFFEALQLLEAVALKPDLKALNHIQRKLFHKNNINKLETLIHKRHETYYHGPFDWDPNVIKRQAWMRYIDIGSLNYCEVHLPGFDSYKSKIDKTHCLQIL